MSKPVAILVHEDYQDLELWYPLLRLREEGKAVSVVSAQPNKTYFSQLEYPVIPDHGIDEVKGQDYGAVIVIGGRSAKIVAEDAKMIRFIKDAAANGALLAAIPEGASAISAAGATPKIAARSTNELPEFCRALFQAMSQSLR